MLLPVSAGTEPITLPTQDRSTIAQTFLQNKLADWQHRLNLDDWEITVRLAPRGELKPHTLGNIHWDVETRSAVIRVLETGQYNLPFQDVLKDMELTVVHELIHLELASLPRSEATSGEEEHAVNRLAGALLRMERPEPRSPAIPKTGRGAD